MNDLAIQIIREAFPDRLGYGRLFVVGPTIILQYLKTEWRMGRIFSFYFHQQEDGIQLSAVFDGSRYNHLNNVVFLYSNPEMLSSLRKTVEDMIK